MIPEFLCRHVVHLGRDAKARLYRYEAWIPGKWAELHGLLTRATSMQIERQAVVLTPERPSTTIEHQYLMTLVLQLIDSGNMTAPQIEQLWEELDGWCASLRLSLSVRAPNAFYVDLASREGLKRRPSSAARRQRAVHRHAAAARAADAATGDARRGRARQAALRRFEARVRSSSRCSRDSPRRSIPSSSRFRAAASARR